MTTNIDVNIINKLITVCKNLMPQNVKKGKSSGMPDMECRGCEKISEHCSVAPKIFLMYSLKIV